MNIEMFLQQQVLSFLSGVYEPHGIRETAALEKAA